MFVSEIIILEAGSSETTEEDEETIGGLTSDGHCRAYHPPTLFLVAVLGVVAAVYR